ncbi:hypothetical protein Slin15195_G118870 [Septoria linicola]|uniref:Uncharacterized protein n=1 Tax=Septoria linicola TaxID=215465 RepID=A0A9Q9B426_9PEZI|nr:hypothetical protein Slin15195_G118870 [Septoria linicola]
MSAIPPNSSAGASSSPPILPFSGPVPSTTSHPLPASTRLTDLAADIQASNYWDKADHPKASFNRQAWPHTYVWERADARLQNARPDQVRRTAIKNDKARKDRKVVDDRKHAAEENEAKGLKRKYQDMSE